jgi:hypothetical protein
MNFCAACGTRLDAGLRFCTGCGAPVRAAQPQPAPAPVPQPTPEAPWAAQPVTAAWQAGEPFGVEPQGEAEGRRRGPLILAALLAVAVVLGVGYALVGRDGHEVGSAERAEQNAGAAATTTSKAPASSSAGSKETARPTRTSGPRGPLRPVSVTATCQAPPGQDAAGTPITYDPAFTLDGVGETAWRCPGSAVGQRLVFDFGTPVTLTSVGLVPGYDKTDPVDGSNRFVDNRTVTGVTWRFDDGSAHRQAIPAPQRAMTTSTLPTPERTQRVVLEITGTGNDTAIRDFTTISDVAFAGY